MRVRSSIAIALATAFATAVPAQGVRISGVTSVQSIDVRPLVNDSVAAATVSGTEAWRTLPSGIPAFCGVDEYCRWKRSGSRVNLVPVLQDLSVAAWGLGQGISVQAQVRARSQLTSGDITWPRADDHFDVLMAYVEADRGIGRLRLGRQWTSSGLGVFDFDGLSFRREQGHGMLEVFGGWSLLAGTDERTNSALFGAVDDLPADDAGLLFGARGRYRPTANSSVAGVYQRTMAANRSQLYSERAALDASVRLGLATLDASLVNNIASGEWEEVRLRAATTSARPWSLMAEARRHLPFFELWTIWGAFSPVGYDEARTVLTYRAPRGSATAGLHGGYRKYRETDAGLDLRTNGWRAGADVSWQPRAHWSAGANYDVDVGFGASSSDATASLRWLASSDAFLGVQGSALQNIYEFRVGTGRVVGLAADGAIRLTPDVRLSFDAGLYRNTGSNGLAVTDWSQRRASLRLEWTAGGDPGARGRATP
ncbi:MAG TPA: hypothetical protein VIK25_07525 [Gemmatimonadaceae bacterium]